MLNFSRVSPHRRGLPYGFAQLTELLSFSCWACSKPYQYESKNVSWFILSKPYLGLCSDLICSASSNGWALILKDELFLLFSQMHHFALSTVTFHLMLMAVIFPRWNGSSNGLFSSSSELMFPIFGRDCLSYQHFP